MAYLHNMLPISKYYQGSILCTSTYPICTKYHDTTKVAYCVPYIYNTLPLSNYYQGSILCTLPTQYAPNIIILPRLHIVYLTCTICSHYHNTTEVSYCVPYLHNMLPLSHYNQGNILCTYLHNMLPLS